MQVKKLRDKNGEDKKDTAFNMTTIEEGKKDAKAVKANLTA